MVLTSKARKASGLKYPVPYASNELAEKSDVAYKFNCGTSFAFYTPFTWWVPFTDAYTL